MRPNKGHCFLFHVHIFSDDNVEPKRADRKKKKLKPTNANQPIATVSADAIDTAVLDNTVFPAAADTEQNKGECHVNVNNANSGHLKKIVDLRCFRLIFITNQNKTKILFFSFFCLAILCSHLLFLFGVYN